MTNKTEIASTAGMLTVGDRFELDGQTWTVDATRPSPTTDVRVILDVKAGNFRQVLPLHFDEQITRIA